MKRNNIGYYIREGINSIFVHGFMSFASVCIIVACLIIMGSFSLLAINVGSIINTMESENQMLAYIDDSMSDSAARDLASTLENLPNVESVYFIDRETALENFKDQFDSTELLEDLETSVLRHRYVVYIEDISLLSDTRADLLEVPGVAKVSAHEGIAKGFITVRNVVSIVSIVLVAILFVISLFIMSNTIKLTTFERRDEIAIMKMVGATSSFIRWPFIVEGLMLGMLGSLIAYILQWGIYKIFTDELVGETGLAFMTLVPFSNVALPMLIVFIVLGFGVGIIGSTAAIRNYLKV